MSEKKKKNATATQRKTLTNNAHNLLGNMRIEATRTKERATADITKALARQHGATDLANELYAINDAASAVRKSNRDELQALRDQYEADKAVILDKHAAANELNAPKRDRKKAVEHELGEMGFHLNYAWRDSAVDPATVCVREGELPEQQFDISYCSDAGQELRGKLSAHTDYLQKLADMTTQIEVICQNSSDTDEILEKLRELGIEI